MKLSFTGNTLSSYFNIKRKTKFEHKIGVIFYLGTCPDTRYNDNYIGEAKQRISLELKTVWKSHLLKYTIENDHQHVSEKDFKIIDGPWGNNKKRQLAEVILIQEIKPTLNIQDPIAVI